MKTVNANIMPFEAIRKRPLAVEQDPVNLPRMKTIKEVAALTGLSYTALRNLCLENKIVHIRVGKKYLINYDRFLDYLNGVVLWICRILPSSIKRWCVEKRNPLN